VSLLAIYDEMLADVAAQAARQGGDIANRAGLLRHQVEQRVVGELGMDVHSFALPALVSYLGQAVRLYLLGFYDAAIVEAAARTGAALRGRLLSLAVWGRLDAARSARLAAVLGQDAAAVAGAWRAHGADPFAALPLAVVVDLAAEFAVFAGPQGARVAASLRDLAAKRRAIDERDADQGRQIALAAVESGRLSGGPGAAHTEPILGYYLTWGATLHLLLADAVVAVCLVLKDGGQPATASR
jgi:hypothetical protein